jgi:hypothetical protein
MRAKYLFFTVFILVLIVSTLLIGSTFITKEASAQQPDVYVGLYAGSTNSTELLALADTVKSYTNLFVVGSTAVTNDLPTLNTVCQRLSDNELNFLTFVHYNETVPFGQWVKYAERTWSTRFLGLYAYDEPGGNQIDHTQYMAVKEANNYADAADEYVQNVTSWLDQLRQWCGQSVPMFTSDYVLYQYDYRAGYDGVFAEFGWNCSRPLQVSLCRGAAETNCKSWGVMITWTYDAAPYMESGKELYEDMVYAYQSGAKYILVFDYAKTTTQGMLGQQHFDAIKQFWDYAKSHPRTIMAAKDLVAYVLPADYGFGFRGPFDSVWGIWNNDTLSAKVWTDTQSLLQQYGSKVDIVYEDSLQLSGVNYRRLILWGNS